MTPVERTENDRLLETFFDLVRIYSPSLGETAVAAYCTAALEAAGCIVRFDRSCERTGSATGNLIAELPGTHPSTLVLSAHMDCVEPCEGVEPVVEDGVVRPAGDTVLGADDKAGIAAIIEAVRRLSEHDAPRPTVRVVLSVAEEIGLVGAKALDPEDVKGDLCLVLDADGATGGIVVAAPTHYTFRARFIGRASHAGVSPETGISAIAMASKAICSMRLGKLDEQTTANVGSIEGGTATNVVPAIVHVTGECRSRDRDTVESVRAEMDGIMRSAASAEGGEVEIAWTLEYEGFRHPADDPQVGLLTDACKDAGVSAYLMETGGGSDANIISALGTPTFALACGMSEVHGPGERIRLDDLFALVRLVECTAARMAGEG